MRNQLEEKENSANGEKKKKLCARYKGFERSQLGRKQFATLPIPILITSMAPPSAEMRKIAEEGFALIDKFYGPPRRSSCNDAFHGRRERCWVVYQVPKPNNDVMDRESAFIGMDTPAPFSGTPAVNYPKVKPQNRYWGRPLKF
ncbi:hypothetical protein VNO78_04681 [Psophocarpus tetragonolobus]|uniref:Uncharacterized protein n=1 Tax=Psophocarpus tetragonolobus TaxID=3891 RepID=A0AAN9XWR8_PSOTE